MHEFLVKFLRRVLHSHQGIRKDTDRRDRSLELMGDIGNKLLSRLVHGLQLLQGFIDGLGDLLCLPVRLLIDILIQVSLTYTPDRRDQASKGLHDKMDREDRKDQQDHEDHHLVQGCLIIQTVLQTVHALRRRCHDHHARSLSRCDGSRLLLKLRNWDCQDEIVFQAVIPARILTLEAPDHLIGNQCLSLRERKRILYDLKPGVYDQDPSTEDIREQGELRIDGGVVHHRVCEISSS